MKILYLAVLLVLSAKGFSQAERARGMEAKAQPTSVIENTESKGTIAFKHKGDPKSFLESSQSFTSYIYTFSSAAEAESFAAAFKNSDPNIASCSFAGKEAGGYYEFSFSVIEKRDVKWYLNLFRQNNLGFIKFDKGPKSIDKLLEK